MEAALSFQRGEEKGFTWFFNELYGSLGSILLLMLLVYFNSLVLLIGFELNVSINSLIHEADERKKMSARTT